VTRIDLHPEELLDRARRGLASEIELERLGAHVAICAACRFEADFARDADAHAEFAGDEFVTARLRRDTLTALSARASGADHFGRSRARRIVILAAALCLVATASAAAVLAVRARSQTPEPMAAAAPALPTKPGKRMEARTPNAEPPTPEADIAPRAPSKQPAKAAEAPRSAAQLFASANSARRKGAVGEAAEGYRELQRAYPGSQEEIVSRVTLGRLLLDRLGDAGGALVQFNSYLANPAHRALREEALIGRALSLGRLGRDAEERSAWNALLSAYPKSAYAERARERLAR